MIEFMESSDTGILKPEWAPATAPSFTSNPRTGASAMSLSAAKLNLAATAKKTVGFAFYNGGGTTASIVSFFADTGGVQHLTLTVDAVGHLQVRRGSNGGTVLATSSYVLGVNQYRHIQFQATIHDSTGTAIVKVDDVEVINFTGDTRNGGVSTNIDAIYFDAAGSGTPRWDDLWVTDGTDDTANTGRPDDGFLGDLKVECLLPSANGASSQWVGSDGNSTDNYLLVDEAGTPNTADYVATSTSGQKDLYEIANPSVAVATVLAVRAGVYAAKSDAGTSGIKIAIRESGGTQTNEPNAPLSTTYVAYHGVVRPSKPGGGAWSVADVQGLQVGVELN